MWEPLNKEIKRKEAIIKELTKGEEISEVIVDENGDEWEDMGDVTGNRYMILCMQIENVWKIVFGINSYNMLVLL